MEAQQTRAAVRVRESKEEKGENGGDRGKDKVFERGRGELYE